VSSPARELNEARPASAALATSIASEFGIVAGRRHATHQKHA
jgi:hypothetical protein